MSMDKVNNNNNLDEFVDSCLGSSSSSADQHLAPYNRLHTLSNMFDFWLPKNNKNQNPSSEEVKMEEDEETAEEILATIARNKVAELAEAIATQLGTFTTAVEYTDLKLENSQCIAKEGALVGEVNFVFDISQSSAGPDYIVVCDRANHRIQEIPLDGVDNTNRVSRVVAQFVATTPSGIVPCKDGTLDYFMVSRCTNETLRVNGVNGDIKWKSLAETATPAKFHYPWGIEVLPDSRVLVSDQYNHRILVLEGATGNLLDEWRMGESKYPRGLAFDEDSGLLYIVENGGTRNISVMLPLVTGGDIVRKIGSGRGTAFGQLSCPDGISLDKFGNFLVVDYDRNCIVVFQIESGNAIAEIPTEKNPVSVYVDSNSNVFVGYQTGALTRYRW